jgi:galactose-6-phosphate isomerase
MPQLDVSDIITDIDYWESGLICMRQLQNVGSNGLAVNTQVSLPFGGVVTQVAGSDLRRGPDGEMITGSILIVTRFRLWDGKSGYSADIVVRETRQYTVANVLNYSRFGRGFVEATCDLLPLAGTYPPQPGTPPTDNYG